MKAVVSFLLGVAAANELAWKELVPKNWEKLDHSLSWKNWKAEFGKSYADLEEEAQRFVQFLDNWAYIVRHNAGNSTFKMGVNQFSDLSLEEFQLQIHGHSGSCVNTENAPIFVWDGSSKSTDVDPGFGADPLAVDWTNHTDGKSYVTAVKNQGSCGSCWAFSSTGALESRYAIKHGVTGDDITTLSEQQLIDCSKLEGNKGCDGGLMDDAFDYVEKAGGLCSEKEYPYTAKTGLVCHAEERCTTKYAAITGYKDVRTDNERSMETAVAEGPVSIAVDAAGRAWQHYKEGIVSKTCGTKLDHGVLTVGYGEEDGTKFWKVKNSWGDTWGEAGYIRLCRDCGAKDGECGMLEYPSYPEMQ